MRGFLGLVGAVDAALDRVFALGPEFNIYVPKPRLTFLVRYEPEFAARNRTQGQTIVFSVAWVAKSLVKHQP